jgi:tetratricopeptide (TPR) repeat protein
VLEFSAHDLDAAEPLYKRAIDIFERRGARDHLVYALALSNLGALYSTRDQVEPARAQFEHAIEMYRAYHPDHPQRLMPLQGLASLALRSGDATHAVEYYEQVQRGMAATYAADSPQLLSVDYNLALAYRSAKQPARAQAVLDELIARTLAPGKESWMLAARALDSAATLADDRKDYPASIALRERALAALSHTDDPATRALVLKQLGQSRRVMHRPDLAIAPLEEALAYVEKHAEDAYDIGIVRYNLALALWESGRDRPRSIELAKLAADDLAKAKTGDELQHYRDTINQFLRARGGTAAPVSRP